VARKLPSEITPPDRVWISLRAQLVEEGIIKIPAEATRAEAAPFWESISDFFRTRALATAMVGILIVAATVFQVRRSRTTPVAPPAQTATAESAPDLQKAPVPEPSEGFDRAARALDDQEPVATGMIVASSSPVDVSLRDNLKKVNEFIADCQRHLKEQPQDALTREYLSAAYEQKAELLSAMIERGRSIN
jgi:hypothetical protein